MFKWIRAGWCALFVAAMTCPLKGFAQSLELHPVSIDVTPDRSSATLNVSNRSAEPVSIQVRSFEWTQQATGPDQLTESGDLIISPPFVSVAPGQSQVIRVLVRHVSRDREVTYRLLIDELPRANDTAGVHLSLHFSVPIFFEAQLLTPARLDWKMTAPEHGDGTLIAVNGGGKRAHLGQLSFSTEGSSTAAIQSNGSAYVLSGAERKWVVHAVAGMRDMSTAKLKVQIDGESQEVTVPVVRVQ